MTAAATPVRVVVADDEPLARERIRMLLERLPGFEVVAECGDGRDAVETVASARPDVVLLDIRMPELDGIEVVEALAARAAEEGWTLPSVVFATAYDEYALRAFEVSAVDYLLKPVDSERLERALRKAAAKPRATAVSPGSGADAAASAPDALAESGEEASDDGDGPSPGSILTPELAALLQEVRRKRGAPQRFVVRDARGLYFVKAADIDWVDAQGNYVRLHAGGRAHLLRDTMKAFEAKLDPAVFVRVHRSAIVNVDRIERLEPYAHGEYIIVLRDGTRLTSSRAHSARLHALIR